MFYAKELPSLQIQNVTLPWHFCFLFGFKVSQDVLSLHRVPLTTSSVATSTCLQQVEFFALKPLTAILKVQLLRALFNELFSLHLFACAKRDSV